MAELKGLVAAKLSRLPQCSRLKPNGDKLIVQQCKAVNASISAVLTECSYEPIITGTNKTDGISIHPFREGLHKTGLTPLNGKSYAWDNSDWIKTAATHHLSKLALVKRFKEIADLEAKYLVNHHVAFDKLEIEPLNVKNELSARLHATNAESITTALIAEKSQLTFCISVVGLTS